jgi:hypothetical protein
MLGTSIVVCMRVASPRQKTFVDGSTGYVHAVGNMPVRQLPTNVSRKEQPVLNPHILLKKWRHMSGNGPLPLLAAQLGVTPLALETLGCLRTHYYKTWAFPMRSGDNHVVGIRLRSEDGRKWAEKGSHQGLFMPQCEPQPTAYIVEGPTDAAAALSLGVYAIGRPSCSGGMFDIQRVISRLNIKRVVIIGDSDEDKLRPDGSHFNPGVDGARNLSEVLGIPNCVLLLPCKDMRQFLSQGGDRTTLDYLASQCLWRGTK